MGKHDSVKPPYRRAGAVRVRIIGIGVPLGALNSPTFPTQEV